MHAKKRGGFLDGVAVLVDQAAGVCNLCRGEGRARPEFHASGLGSYAAGSGPVDAEVWYDAPARVLHNIQYSLSSILGDSIARQGGGRRKSRVGVA